MCRIPSSFFFLTTDLYLVTLRVNDSILAGRDTAPLPNFCKWQGLLTQVKKKKWKSAGESPTCRHLFIATIEGSSSIDQASHSWSVVCVELALSQGLHQVGLALQDVSLWGVINTCIA